MRLPRALGAICALGALASCDHSRPFGYDVPETPRPTGAPARLTLNPLPDVTPTWLPDGSAILYASSLGERSGDRCLMTLPPDGGRASTLMCYPLMLVSPSDTLYTIAWPSFTPAGRLVYSSTSSRRSVAGRVRQIKWADSVRAPTRLHDRNPATMDLFGGRYLEGVSFLQWLDGQRFVYRADFLGSAGPDSVISGRFLVLATINGDTLDRAFIPGTDYASSVAVVHPDTILFTRGNDSRIISLVLSSGVTAVVHDFGPGRVVRDLHAAGSRVVAIVGGFTQWIFAAGFQDTIQIDRGGAVWYLDRRNLLVASWQGDTTGWRHPALQPGGGRVVAVKNEDLYLLTVP